MNDVCILHLSDLHFDMSGAQPNKLYEALLYDIRKELKYTNNLVIVVTGDLMNRANYDSKKIVLDFFVKLKELVIDQLKKELYGLYFVPGNHDKERTYSTNVLGSIDTKLDADYYNNFNRFIKEAYRKYRLLIKDILNIFGLTYTNNELTYGSEEISVHGKYFRFVRLDTAWSATGDEDRRNLKVGQFQIDEIQRQYKSQQDSRNNNEKDEVTIVLAHHPLNWLSGTEEDLVRNFLIGQRGIEADIYVCGHTHTRDIINWSNNRHSLVTLSTGIGWPDSFDSDHSDLHAYAIYVIHLDLNAIDIYVRSTNDGGTFVPDYRIYTSDENRKNNKIVLPLKSTAVQSYLTLSSVDKRSPKVCFLSNAFLEDIQKFVFAMGCFRQFVVEIIEGGVRTLANDIELIQSGKAKKDIYDKINQHFLSFLQAICDLLAEEILSYYKFEVNDRIRFHFRYCSNADSNKELLLYKKLCLSYWPDKNIKEKSLSTIEWGQLIKDAYIVKRPLIYSLNPDNCEKKTKWLDFITIIPDFAENGFMVDEQHMQESRPYLTFGASITSEKFRNILYCLDYYRFDRILATLLRRYLTKIPISIKQFITYINEQFANNSMEG